MRFAVILLKARQSKFSINKVPADGLALEGAKVSTRKEMIIFGSCMYMGHTCYDMSVSIGMLQISYPVYYSDEVIGFPHNEINMRWLVLNVSDNVWLQIDKISVIQLD